MGAIEDLQRIPVGSSIQAALRTMTPEQITKYVLPALVETIEVRTLITPPIVFNTREFFEPGPPSPTSQLLKPTVIITGGVGRRVIAPSGEIESEDWKIPAFVAGATLAFGVTSIARIAFSVGKRYSKGRKRKR